MSPIFHFPLPAKLLVELGPAVDLAGCGPADADDPKVLRRLSDEVRGAANDDPARG